MATQPSPALSGYQRSARSLGAKSALPLAAAAAALLPASAHAQAVAFHPTTGNVVATYGQLFINTTNFTLSPTTGEVRIEVTAPTGMSTVASISPPQAGKSR